MTVTEPTETATAAAFAHTAVLAGRPGNAEPLAEAGRLFGRLAHLLDAVEDRGADAASGAWNPLTATGTPLTEARRLADDAVHGIRLALREAEFTDAKLAHRLLVHELRTSVDRAFGTASCAHGPAPTAAMPGGPYAPPGGPWNPLPRSRPAATGAGCSPGARCGRDSPAHARCAAGTSTTRGAVSAGRDCAPTPTAAVAVTAAAVVTVAGIGAGAAAVATGATVAATADLSAPDLVDPRHGRVDARKLCLLLEFQRGRVRHRVHRPLMRIGQGRSASVSASEHYVSRAPGKGGVVSAGDGFCSLSGPPAAGAVLAGLISAGGSVLVLRTRIGVCRIGAGMPACRGSLGNSRSGRMAGCVTLDRHRRGVAQLARAPVSKTGCRRFDSCHPCCCSWLARGTMYCSGRANGAAHLVRRREPFLEARTGADDPDELLKEVRAGLAPEFRAAGAVFEPGRLADAAIRHKAAARV